MEKSEILAKELCGRLPYGLKVVVGTPYDFENDITDIGVLRGIDCNNPSFGVKGLVEVRTSNGSVTMDVALENCKPLLRPLDSMTDLESVYYNTVFTVSKPHKKVEWLNEHHFDYTNLIEQGYAIAAYDDTYDLNNLV